jgi:hypothetical protein
VRPVRGIAHVVLDDVALIGKVERNDGLLGQHEQPKSLPLLSGLGGSDGQRCIPRGRGVGDKRIGSITGRVQRETGRLVLPFERINRKLERVIFERVEKSEMESGQ